MELGLGTFGRFWGGLFEYQRIRAGLCCASGYYSPFVRLCEFKRGSGLLGLLGVVMFCFGRREEVRQFACGLFIRMGYMGQGYRCFESYSAVGDAI